MKVGDKVTWDELQKHFTKRQKFPYGTEFELIHRKSTAGAERRARSTQIKFTLGKFQGYAADNETITDLSWSRLAASLENPPSRDKFIIRVKGPNNERPKGNNFSAGGIRLWVGLPTPEDIEAEEELQYEIEEVRKSFDLNSLENASSGPDTLLRAIFRTLLPRYSSEEIRLKLDEEIVYLAN